MTNEKILEIRGLKQYFITKKGIFGKKNLIKAVDNVSFDLYNGEILGIVGESGSGKSTLLRSIIQLMKPLEGSVIFRDQDLVSLSNRDFLPLRRDLQMVFQDPYSSLNPRMTVEEIIAEPLYIYKRKGLLKITKKEIHERVKLLLKGVNLSFVCLDRYPHEFSGGQRQRIGIARALALNPSIILADEPVSALDVSIQSQILNLFKDLRKNLGISYIFVAHDLAVIKYIADRILVMYAGWIVESASAEELYKNPIHPYTKALLAAVPIPDPNAMYSRQIFKSVNEDTEEQINNFFSSDYYDGLYAKKKSANEYPVLREIKPGHFVAFFDEEYQLLKKVDCPVL